MILCEHQSKRRQYDQEVENLERQQKQTIERLEQEHTNHLRDEAKRIKGEQEKELSKHQNMLKNRKKEVRSRLVEFSCELCLVVCFSQCVSPPAMLINFSLKMYMYVTCICSSQLL